MPMTQTSTPTTQGPSLQTIDFIRSFARSYQTKAQQNKVIVTLSGNMCPVGIC